MGNIPSQTVICKYLDLLGLPKNFPLFDYRRTLTFYKAVSLYIDAILNKRPDGDSISLALKANQEMQRTLDLKTISASQVNRTLAELPRELLETIWHNLHERLQQCYPREGIADLGKLIAVDSSTLKLSDYEGKWAHLSKSGNGVKFHTKVVVEQGLTYTDGFICSTRAVDDSEVALELVVDPDAIHILDRGYIVYSHYNQWKEKGIRFVARIQKRNKTMIVETREIDPNSSVLCDADVIVTYKNEQKEVVEVKLRLVEYTDEKGRLYRVLTDVWNLSAQQISEVYRYRWRIELLYKWMKQHLSLVHLYSEKPEAVWNLIYLALIAHELVMILRKEANTSKSLWDFLKFTRLYLYQTWEALFIALHQPPSKHSNGRKKKGKVGRPRKTPKKLVSVKMIVH
jgi:hypothetical protein